MREAPALVRPSPAALAGGVRVRINALMPDALLETDALTKDYGSFRALSALTTGLYFGDPRTWPGLGYPGPPDPAALRQAYAGQLVDLDALLAPGAPEDEGA